MAKWIVKVQADRVQSNDEASETWLALQVCAELKLDSADVPTQTWVDSLAPWNWAQPGGAAGSWDPHDAAAWKVWAIADGTLLKAVVLTLPAVSRVPPASGILGAAQAAIADIAADDAGVRGESLRFGPRDAPTDLAGTVPGYVQRLAASAYPVPSETKVHALLAIDAREAGERVQFIAAPLAELMPGVICEPGSGGQPAEDAEANWVAPGAVDVVMKPSQRKADMAGGGARLLDLFAQSVMIASDADGLPSADALIALPQRLADALDPLTRLRSVLPRVLEARSASAELDLAKLGEAIAVIAAQVLAPRFDMIGRFEVPMLDALLAGGRQADLDLLRHHLANLPGGLAPLALPAAMRFGEADLALLGMGTRWTDLSPITAGMLTDPARSAPPAGEGPLAEPELLKRIWGLRGTAGPGPNYGVRYLELDAAASAGPDIVASVEWRAWDREAPQTGPAGVAFADASFADARAAMALAYAAPFVEGLVSGRVDWLDPAAPPSAAPSLAARLGESMQALLLGPAGLYRTLHREACRIAGVVGTDPEAALLEALLADAAREAVRIARRLAPVGDHFDRLTQIPLPLTLQVDQLRTFSRHVDDWARLSGYGLLLRRIDSGANNFVSLNAASLYFGPSAGTRPATNTIASAAAVLSGAGTRLAVDPLPYSPGDMIGISDAIAEYANRWHTAPMPGDALVSQQAAAVGKPAAQIIAGPPLAEDGAVKLPALSFGKTYELIGHLVPAGGVLAPFLRDPANPYRAKPVGTGMHPAPKAVPYLRTVAVGAPTVRTSASPPPPDVPLLAAELPRRLPSQRLGAGELRLNYDHPSGRTVVDWLGAGDAADGLRLEFVVDNQEGAAVDLAIAISDGEPGTVPVGLAAVIPPGTAGLWCRVDVAKQGEARLWLRRVGDAAEDELLPENVVGWTLQPGAKPTAFAGEGAYLRIAGAGLHVEQIRTVPLTYAAGDATEAGDRLTPAARTPARSTWLLDGLDLSTPVGPRGTRAKISNNREPRTIKLTISGPSTDRHTFERWVNLALLRGAGDPQRKTVAAKLNALQAKGPPRDGDRDEQSLPDPAVSGLWIALWEVFPRRYKVAEDLVPATGLLAAPNTEVTVVVADAPSLRRGTASVVPGHVYELHCRAAIRPDDAPFDHATANEGRFGRAVLETFSDVITENGRWLLGPASVQTIEVATAELPQIERSDVAESAIRPIETAATRRVALVLGEGLAGAGGRRTLRYCSTAELVPQRWSWRGRPRPTQWRQAFYDRRDDDVGRIVSGALHAAHAIGIGPASGANAPAVLDLDLQWRGGWNVWRFDVELVSRYAALFAGGHRIVPRLSFRAAIRNWIYLSVRDGDNGRQIARPPIALVLPLTEADASLVPPLLAIFSGPFHEHGHFGDGIAVGVAMARHPMPAFQRARLAAQVPGLKAKIASLEAEASTASPDRAAEIAIEIDRIAREIAIIEEAGDPARLVPPVGADGKRSPVADLKFIGEFGLDPARTGAAHDGSPIRLQLDGPVGYGFDAGFDTGHYGHSGFLVVPRDRIAPWSMIKLTFRRVEDPEGLDAPPSAGSGPHRIAGAIPDPRHPIRHEGLAVDVPAATGDLSIALDPPPDGADRPGGQRILLSVRRDGDALTISATVVQATDRDAASSDWTDQGAANAGTGSWVGLEPTEDVTLRLLIALRPKPTTGETWRATGDAVVQMRRGPADRWQSLFELPLEMAKDIALATDPGVKVGGSLASAAEVRPIRISESSPSVWCQFTVSSRHVLVRNPTNGAAVLRDVDELRLTAANKAGGVAPSDFVLTTDAGSPRLLLPDQQAVGTPSIAEHRIAILTEQASDIGGRLRERPLLAALLADDIRGAIPVTRIGDQLWPDPRTSPVATIARSSGRWRLMRVLTRAGVTLRSLEDLFAEDLSPAISDTPADARAMVLSVSPPSLWTVAD